MTDVTQILSAIEQGDAQAAEQLFPLVYEELRKLATHKMAQEKPGQTLQATALVHEAYIRLVDVEKAQHWDSRGHFFATAAEEPQGHRLGQDQGWLGQDQGWLGQSGAVPQGSLTTSLTGASLRSAASHPAASHPTPDEPEDIVTQTAQFSVRFDGANAVSPSGMERAETVFNYLVGEQDAWRSGVPAFETVAYEGLYDGIDLLTWGQRDSLKYEFHVAPWGRLPPDPGLRARDDDCLIVPADHFLEQGRTVQCSRTGNGLAPSS